MMPKRKDPVLVQPSQSTKKDGIKIELGKALRPRDHKEYRVDVASPAGRSHIGTISVSDSLDLPIGEFYVIMNQRVYEIFWEPSRITIFSTTLTSWIDIETEESHSSDIKAEARFHVDAVCPTFKIDKTWLAWVLAKQTPDIWPADVSVTLALLVNSKKDFVLLKMFTLKKSHHKSHNRKDVSL